MRYTIAYVFAVLIAVTTGQADATVGFQHFSINDPQGPPIEVGVWYPTTMTPKLEAVETDQQMVARDAPLEGTGLPLVVISHGHGGSYVGHLDTATAWPMQGSSSLLLRTMATAGATRAVLPQSGNGHGN